MTLRNSSKLIFPSPFVSAILIILSIILSGIICSESVKTLLNSSGEMNPELSISNILKAVMSFASVKRDFSFEQATINSVYSMYPELSVSAS